MSETPAHPTALGIFVGPDAIDAVLVRRRGDEAEVLRRLSRQRARAREFVTAESLQAALPGLHGAEDSDYTIHVGDGSPTRRPEPGGADTHPVGAGRPFAHQLQEILRECAGAGVGRPQVVFCIAPPEVTYTELLLAATEEPRSAKSGKAARPDVAEQALRADRRALGALAKDRISGVDLARVAFVPLASSEDRRRYLAVAPDPGEPVAPTLKLVAEQHPEIALQAARLDSEATLWAAAAGRAGALVEGERTAFVRVGTESTLLLLFEGNELSHVERVRSVTAYDLPDTVASRILHVLDERKVGDPDAIIVATVARDTGLTERFRHVYPEATVHALHEMMAGLGIEMPEDDGSALRSGPLAAAAAALGQLDGWGADLGVDLLPPAAHRRRRPQGAFAWHTALAAGLLVFALAAGVFRYVRAEQRADVLREDLRVNPPPQPVEDPDVLQARVDSLANAYQVYTRGLNVLDSLLVGSDRWIQTMRLVTRSTDQAGGTWITRWQPEGSMLRLTGQTLSRTNIVDLARRLDGAIETVAYTDIGTTRVYTFEMVFAVPNAMPQVAVVLRSLTGNPYPDSTLEIGLPTPAPTTAPAGAAAAAAARGGVQAAPPVQPGQ
jgi:hypothetical protein